MIILKYKILRENMVQKLCAHAYKCKNVTCSNYFREERWMG
jgi:hypothetical protein